jgi:hypothetical protein
MIETPKVKRAIAADARVFFDSPKCECFLGDGEY